MSPPSCVCRVWRVDPLLLPGHFNTEREVDRESFMKPFRFYSCIVLIMAVIVATGNVGSPVPADEIAAVETIRLSSKDLPRTTTPQARRQAEILHTSIHATLQVVHDRYYREDEGLPIPAAIMGDVFKEIESEQNVGLRWLAVEGLAMNTDHLPQDTFETDAVRLLKSGEKFHEITEQGLYRRAAPITLSSHCLKCHMPDRKSTADRKAGLIISIPVED